ncbi:hypothetical protein N7414_15725 [Pseudomonas sp. GD04087]|uniref:LamG domain-containing protein n=1 Tax=unclassified Pseudomonas TaxID=196821 RepID=UPI0024481592|nr:MULTISPECIES: LamG domain-containing protein [unclassified Pseudomonas]MDH0290573.1 hypothetical protein [Pseudomonas sp. GD04087]MDH1051490.1 hypothetical protein [Pseudomonas sp. GD03903]MDH2003076.1 hypothetical protein [Pseudomonas sp. GD03691]
MGTKNKAQTVGYRYSFDIHFGLGLPLDEICEIQASDKTAWKGSITANGQIRINAPNLFGGDKGEGGLDGTLDVMFGEEDQAPVAKLVSMLGGVVPGFRGITTAFYSGLVTSMNPYPKPWKILRRGGNRLWDNGAAWYPEKQFIWLADGKIKAMNPAHILYLMYTGSRFRGLPRTRMDDAAWRAAADKLYDEQLGLCLEWKRSDTFKTFRDSVLAHISAEVYLDRRQALISIRLLRDDYDVTSLPLFDEDSGLLEITRDEASSNDGSSVPSIMVVKYVDAIDGKSKQVKGVNSAVAARDGGQTVEAKDYPGAPTGEIAGRLLQRDLRIATSGLKRYKVVLDRRGRDLNPGQPFRIRSLKRGIGEVIVRVGRFEDGTLTDGRITITALQDVFGLPVASYIAVPPVGWLPPDREPRAVITRRLFEVPYRELAGVVDPANLASIGPTQAWLAAIAEAPTSMSMSYSMTDRVGATGSFVDRGVADWSPTGQLAALLPQAPGPSVVTLSNYSRLEDITVGMAAMVDDEIVRVDAVNYTTAVLTLARGCADTLPAAHAAGARIWFYDSFEAVDETSYTQGTTLQARLLTNTSIGQLDPALAGIDSLTFVGRQGRPYAPGLFRINGKSVGDSSITGPLSVTWANRNRLSQADQLIDHAVGSITLEAGATTSLNVYGETDTLIQSLTGLTGTSWSWSESDESAASGLTLDVDLAGLDAAILADAPYSYYKLDSGSGASGSPNTVAVDSSGNSRNGTWVAGAFAQKYLGVQSGRFQSSGRVTMPSGLANWSNGISLFALWLPNSQNSYERILDLSNGQSSNNVTFSRFGAAAGLYFGWFAGSTQGPSINGGAVVQNKWNLVGITMGSDRVAKLWVNGVVVATATLASLPTNITRTVNYIGESPWGNATSAAIASVAIFDKGISDARAVAYWNAVKDQLNKARLNNRLRIEAWTVRGGINSLQRYNQEVFRT